MCLLRRTETLKFFSIVIMQRKAHQVFNICMSGNLTEKLHYILSYFLHESIFFLGIDMSVSKLSIRFRKRVISTKWGTSCLFTTSIWQILQRVHIVDGLWFSWRHDALFWHWSFRFFPRVAATMISKSFVKLSIMVHFKILWKMWSKDGSYII